MINNENARLDLDEKHKMAILIPDHIFEDFQVYGLIFELFQTQQKGILLDPFLSGFCFLFHSFLLLSLRYVGKLCDLWVIFPMNQDV